jgi:2-amino-4-hydroxy-6-hydroxymethyldihydropteridine diphosphokinase
MSLIIATGSNIGDSVKILNLAKELLGHQFEIVAESRIYTSQAVDYVGQPDFFNQVLEFRLPALTPQNVMANLLLLEKNLGRSRDIPKGPRTLDLDIIFWGLDNINGPDLIVPHPRWIERSFVVKPLKELPFFKTLEKCFTIPMTFDVDAFPII